MLLAIALIIAVPVTLSCGSGQRVERTNVHVGTATFNAELALTPAKRAVGLGGRDGLPRDAGMLFVFPTEGRETFWMKGMRFPLDFVWITEDRHVLGVRENVSQPPAGTADSALPLYKPDAPIRYALEINAGLVAELGISVGDEVTFEPEVDPGRAR